MDISDLLKDWEFGELAQQFIENGINMEVLKICRFEDISSLLSPLSLGSKILFKRKLGRISERICLGGNYFEAAVGF
ncbi:hypothetical protein JTE90_006770 [Oedothorax gibbosus]|uniref:SAM domain-containing protein n=1 Tax=Oedothorax gibbosus TaxID=931172 RepID=A0AAV6UJS5_9ARAC|nr:hypothetical protein JTE90_006770 [Oedothorax gibbosus]